MDAQTTFDSAAFLLKAQPFFDLHAGVALAPINTLIEMQFDNGVSVYGNKIAVKEISELVAQYPSI